MNTTRLTLIASAISLALVTGCEPATTTPTYNHQSNETAAVSTQSESERANALFEQIFDDEIATNPVRQTQLGLKTNYGLWQDLSDERHQQDLQLAQQHLSQLKKLNTDALDPQVLLSYQLMKQRLEHKLEDDQWRLHSYPVNQMRGTHTQVPVTLLNQHRIDDESDAKAYISRLNRVPQLFEQLQHQLEQRAELGVIVPKFVFPYVIQDSQNVITGAPFDDGEDSILWADFKRKVAALSLSDAEQQLLLNEAELALLSSVQPAYQQLIGYLQQLEQLAGTDDGVWRLPDGKAFYQHALNRMTTTELTAEQIHQIGLDDVDRIHQDMLEIMQQVEFDGSLQDFFAFMRTDSQFYYPDTEQGRSDYLTEATALIDHMRTRLDELFLVKPKAEMEVRAVEPFREQSAGKAFYQRPSMDGSRPGIYYANLYRMSDMPKYQMEALAYHEGLPGHHMQLAIQQELEDIPRFRRFGGYTAYTEGWGLYTELLPKEIGLYQDPYSDFGRLAMELWRSARLVVDTGLHHKGWTREEAIQYLVDNTPNPAGDAQKAIERYIVMPAQATAYKIGMIRMLELRETAINQLGDRFDIREFHDVVLKNGAVPLDVLEQLVHDYIALKQH
ncbi:DUF885 domain-containing protein [Alkalimonas collagenimarina]|uniref:DUF885 domain-containing protein n=1 Tax=Alkalimonas collagenimarina TaxID=400390 RepID=A0ABT9GU90_9GAMM|nr:DUF885 domain-containing protein [Alkalimonas collagenimarina]MDP4534618.1 DUF885 domain-containing protein [Alkalimonas collagenimarina]